MSDDRLTYRRPAKLHRSMSRRVYVLPRTLVQRIHDYGHEHGHESEVAAVRELLEAALDRMEARK